MSALESAGRALGAASIGAVMQARLAAEPAVPAGHATAMGQSLLFCVAILGVGIAAAAGFARSPVR
ncbi:hypothetical protein GCM10027569_38300 [Flindersiella endophytica]